MLSFKKEPSMGIQEEETSEFLPLMYTERPNEDMFRKAAKRSSVRWEKMSGALIKKGNWARLGKLAKSLNS